MLRIVTSLSFLYALAILLLLVYGWVYYRDFARSAKQRKRFPIVFFVISIACFAFLWINIHAPLSLKTFSNLDHHFIRHDGFVVHDRIELGRADTVNFSNNSYNSFILDKQDKEVAVTSAYSEDPFYIKSGDRYKIVSKTYPATGQSISFRIDAIRVTLKVPDEKNFELLINDQAFAMTKEVKKGISAWNIFKESDLFINSVFYNNERLAVSLRHLFLVRDNVTAKGGEELQFFLSGRIFRNAGNIVYGQQPVSIKDIAFKAPLPPASHFAWGIGFLDNNKNQFRVQEGGNDSFMVFNRYPVSYPLTEEKNNDWSQRTITKFLVSDSKDLPGIPSVLREGFLFSAFEQDNKVDFDPVLLTYKKEAADKSIGLNAKWLNRSSSVIDVKENQLLLTAKSAGFNWMFSIRNTFSWEFGQYVLSPIQWQLLLFGSLLFFFALIFLTSLITPANRLSWVWQLLSSVTMVLLTTRFFLYWRYKSFPPYEGLDLPSQQQLQSFWNFGIIIFATIILALLFGYSFIRFAWTSIRQQFSKGNNGFLSNGNTSLWEKTSDYLSRVPMVKRYGSKAVFFISWLLILMAAGAFAYISHFDPGTCRHLAIGLTFVYFVYVFISYRYSPLVTSSERSWWSIHTGRTLDLVISNPVKVLLSISLLAVFVFTDIGFAIVFLNFLLFNEAFLCINYAIAGLSAGSRKNALLFGITGSVYLLLFVANLLYAPWIFSTLLSLPQTLYLAGYIFFAVIIAYHLLRLFSHFPRKKKLLTGSAITFLFFLMAFFFFPKEKILDKAAMTKYRIDVLTMPVDKAIALAYAEGKTYEPVIRAAQNQWFINTLIYEENNPGVQSPGFHLLPHAPQNKGAKYNAQATDLVASRFFLAEHGKWSVLFYVLLLLVPTILLASFYQLYPDFTNRVNERYPTITAGFSILNYLLITALLVILAATGRYIFFGQDMPFGSILSKQSILFPSILIITVILLFRNIPLEYYANRKKFIPGAIVFSILAVLLFLVKPVFNKNKEFNVSGLAKNMDDFVQLRLQPVMDYFDTAKKTRRYPVAKKDQLFTDSLRKLLAAGFLTAENKFFTKEIELYSRLDFSRHLDQSRMLYLDLYSGAPQLSVNDNYFRVEPPPHLQQSWTGNVFGDSSVYNIFLADNKSGSVIDGRLDLNNYTHVNQIMFGMDITLSVSSQQSENVYKHLSLVNTSQTNLHIKHSETETILKRGDSLLLCNPWKGLITDEQGDIESQLVIEPDAFMKNYYVNGNRFYVYPMGKRFIWARNFSESIASEYTAADRVSGNAAISLGFELMDSLTLKIQRMMNSDTAYKKGAEYGICVADGNGRMLAMADYIKDFRRPDPNDKAGFTKTIMGENGFVSQSLLRKQIGNINLLRLNPGPGSTLKPIVFSAIASQLNLDWDAFAAEGFSEPQQYFGGQKVAEYDFEKNNGRISNVIDYLKYSDNYYYSNVLLLGSYPKQDIDQLLIKSFLKENPGTGLHWPYFSYQGSQYWLDGFENWPGYANGKANFGSDSSFTSIGLFTNYGIYTKSADKSFDIFSSGYDSSLFLNGYSQSGFLLPEYPLFDQQGEAIDRRIPYDVFTACFRGHVKGSSQVMIPPTKMVESFGKLVSQSRNYSLTLNPYAAPREFSAFVVDHTIVYNNYLSLLREGVFEGLKQVLYTGTAARLGSLLPKDSKYFYYAKTGTTGDNEVKTKSKLLTIVISEKDITDPAFNFRNNKFYTVYFTLQNGPAKQNEEFQAEIIRYIEQSAAFVTYMASK